MSRRVAGQEHIRKLGKTGSSQNPSYFITLPISYIRQLSWREGQKIEVTFNEKTKSIEISDFKSN